HGALNLAVPPQNREGFKGRNRPECDETARTRVQIKEKGPELPYDDKGYETQNPANEAPHHRVLQTGGYGSPGRRSDNAHTLMTSWRVYGSPDCGTLGSFRQLGYFSSALRMKS